MVGKSETEWWQVHPHQARKGTGIHSRAAQGPEIPRGPLTLGNLLSSRRTQSIVFPLDGLGRGAQQRKVRRPGSRLGLMPRDNGP